MYNSTITSKSFKTERELVSLLPCYPSPEQLFVANTLPCHFAEINYSPTEIVLKLLEREQWIEGLFVKLTDLSQIKKYKNSDGNFKNDFNENQFLSWVTAIEENTVICDMENQSVGKGVFVSPGKILPANTFIPSSGIIKLNPSMLELATKVHCSALQDLESCQKPIIGIIDPEVQGGLLNLINHAPTEDELANFIFAKSFSTKSVAIANLRSIIKFYQGFAIMGVEVMEDINGGEFGQQLLWSYARPDEYLDASSRKSFLLFDCRPRSNGEILDPQYYSLKEIEIFIDTGEILLRQVAVLTRWEIMETSPETHLVVAPEDPYSFNLSKPVQSPVTYKTLQIYLKSNPLAERIILKVPLLNL